MTEAPARTAMVTGASTGIGRAIALALGRAGFDLAVTDLDAGWLAGLVKEPQLQGRKVVPIALDLRSQDGIAQAMEQAAQALGAVDLLVNNAGRALQQPATEVTWAEWDDVIDINLKGSFFLSTAFARHCIDRKRGARADEPGSGRVSGERTSKVAALAARSARQRGARADEPGSGRVSGERTSKVAALAARSARQRGGVVVSIASTHGLTGIAGRCVYGISKGGIIQMTRMLAVEWAPLGIRVNAIAPATVLTPSREKMLSDPQARARMLARIPLGRFPTAEEVAEAVCYLGSDVARSITGQTLVLDGGVTVI
jgi:NAD(P)-dependent dehydrogenase (short-subunit alcohol dehydrogenase family)